MKKVLLVALVSLVGCGQPLTQNVGPKNVSITSVMNSLSVESFWIGEASNGEVDYELQKDFYVGFNKPAKEVTLTIKTLFGDQIVSVDKYKNGNYQTNQKTFALGSDNLKVSTQYTAEITASVPETNEKVLFKTQFKTGPVAIKLKTIK